ncbi:type II toxin-antitoxin system HicA family toxin [Desulfovibrio inopinatus]|uniref:type II toxin-antitoxin system HicA family toxin n=1 Tax=Desulfovibrio inopinatus TaxID=102109 RepID=UPI0004844729|nr:type II toxin-antitoxin system HicA family toxin [Desulfovibrio inopinatus]
MTSKEVIQKLVEAGWVERKKMGTRKSKNPHRQFKHPDNPSLVSVPVHGKKDIASGTLRQIEQKSGVKLT